MSLINFRYWKQTLQLYHGQTQGMLCAKMLQRLQVYLANCTPTWFSSKGCAVFSNVFLLQFMPENWRELQAYYRSLSTPPKLVLFLVCKPFIVKRDYTEMESVHGLCCWQQGQHKKKKKQTSCPVCCFPHYLTEEHSLTMLCQYSGKLTSVIEFLKTIWLLSAWKSPKSKAQHFKKAQKTTKYLQDSFNNRREHFKPPNLPT